MKEINIDFAKLKSIEDIHNCLQKKLRLPAYYGRNLDALYDILSERKNIKKDIKVVILNYELSDMHTYMEKLMRVFKACDIETEFKEFDERN